LQKITHKANWKDKQAIKKEGRQNALASQGVDLKEDMIYISQSCGSPDVYPGSRFFFIPDPGSQNPDPTTIEKKEGENLFGLTFLVAINFTKLSIILFLNR
jgi:hypothetical protein